MMIIGRGNHEIKFLIFAINPERTDLFVFYIYCIDIMVKMECYTLRFGYLLHSQYQLIKPSFGIMCS
ncbi:hypothetical protein D3C73_1040030 [compost metagenome]